MVGCVQFEITAIGVWIAFANYFSQVMPKKLQDFGAVTWNYFSNEWIA